MTNLPKDLKYSEFAWLQIEGKKAKIGVTDYAIKAAKEIIMVDLPEVDKVIKKGEDFVSIESVKWSGHIASPVSGKVVEVNNELFDEPQYVSEIPYEAWICKIELSDPKELDSLEDAKSASEKWTK